MLEKQITSFFMLILFLWISAIQGFAQCTPDQTVNHTSNYPETWKTGCVGTFYEDTVYFTFPRDTLFVTFSSFEVIGHNLPSWASIDCNAPGCKWTPSNSPTSSDHIFGCLRVYGTPDTAFSGVIDIDIEGCTPIACDNDVQDFNLTILDTVQVDFTSTVVENSVDFADASTGGPPPLSYNWNFGDGAASSLPNPTHVYAAVGTYPVCYTVSDQCGDFKTCRDVTITMVSLDPDPALKSWTIAPNPSSGKIRVEGDLQKSERVDISILSLHGKKLKETAYSNPDLHFRRSVDLTDLPAGVYLLEIQAGMKHTVRRIQRI